MASVAIVAALLGSALSGCSAIRSLTQCARGVDTADAATKGLIDATRSAKTPSDICQWVTPTMSVSKTQLNELKKVFVNEQDKSLKITVGDQMGSTVPVVVTSNDGTVSETFEGSADDHGKWTIAFGTPRAETAQMGPTSAAIPLPTP